MSRALAREVSVQKTTLPQVDLDAANPRKPNPVDVHVGGRVRLRRMLLGMSQEKLGEHLGLTFQQVQKYEKGANRIGASRLFDIARVLDVPIGYFFEEMSEDTALKSPSQLLARGRGQIRPYPR